MSNPPKTTEELVQALKKEMDACIKGQRTFPMPDNADEKVVEICGTLGALVGAEGMLRIGFYHDFREQVWKYQSENNISSIVIQEFEFNGKTFRLPAPDGQLIFMPGDLEIMQAAKPHVIEAFTEFCRGKLIYCNYELYVKGGGSVDIQTTPEHIKFFIEEYCQWAQLFKRSEGIAVCCGWGDPLAQENTEENTNFWFEIAVCSEWHPPIKAERVSLSVDEIIQKRKNGEFDR